MLKHLNFIIITTLLLLIFAGCGIKKFPSIPFIKSTPKIDKLDYKIQNGKLLLNWPNIKDKNIKGYNIYTSSSPTGIEYCTDCDKNFKMVSLVDTEGFEDTASITIENLKDKFSYCYAVKSVNKNGKESPLSNKVCFDWELKNNIIGNINVHPKDRSLKISWEKGNVEGINFQGVNIYKKDKSGSSIIANEPSNNEYLVKNLKNGEKYTFFIAPIYYFNKTLIEGQFVEVSGIPEDFAPPELPKFFNGFYTNGAILLKWSRSLSDDIFGYDIFRRGENEKNFKEINKNIIKEETYFDSQVEKGKVYYYKIRCIDKKFNPSEFSNEFKVIAE